MSRITISDVAAAAGVSISTASKALNGNGVISPATIRKIHSAARQMGYQPNRAAQFLAAKSKTIGILMPCDPKPVYSLFGAGLEEALNEYNSYGFNAVYTFYAQKNDSDGFQSGLRSLSDSVNGLIFISGYHLNTYENILRDIAIPKISLQIAAPSDICPSVTVDEIAVGKMAAEFLSICISGREVAIITGNSDMVIHKKNIEGFRQEAGLRDLRIAAIEESFDDFDTAYRITGELLSLHPSLNGIFVSSYVAPAVCQCLKERGLSGVIRVIGVDAYDKNAACLQDGSLTAIIYQNQKLQSNIAVELLLSEMLEQNAKSVKIKPELVLNSNILYYLN